MLTRRQILSALAASPLALQPFAARAKEFLDLKWEDLLPDTPEAKLQQTLRGLGIVEHGELSTGFTQQQSTGVRDDYNGQIVRLPGFIVPLDFDSTGVTTFILAPFVGACIHVPPPPANQLVLVTSAEPYEYEGLYDPVYVTGMFGTAATSTALAQIGYALSADQIEPYVFPGQSN